MKSRVEKISVGYTYGASELTITIACASPYEAALLRSDIVEALKKGSFEIAYERKDAKLEA